MSAAPGPVPPASVPPRDIVLDAARGVAVAAMVLGHTMDALLDSAARARPWAAAYWEVRGLTAPLFLLVSGWAVGSSILRSQARGAAAVRARLPRALLLLGLGYLLRVPLWNTEGLLAFDPSIWRHFLAFDALHCIGASLVLAGVVHAFASRPGVRALVFLSLGLVVATTAAPLWRALAQGPMPAAQMLGGGDSPFPLWPWASYFLLGAALGSLPPGPAPARFRAALLAGAGLVLVLPALLGWAVLDSPLRPAVTMWRTGQVLLVLGVVGALPAAALRALARPGRQTLGIYLLHVPILYGFGTWEGLVLRTGPVLPPAVCALLGALLLAGCWLATVLLCDAWRALQRLGSDAVGALSGRAEG